MTTISVLARPLTALGLLLLIPAITPFSALAANPLQVSARVDRIKLSRTNLLSGFWDSAEPPSATKDVRLPFNGKASEIPPPAKWDRHVQCTSFSGTHAGNTLRIRIEATGGTGPYHHLVTYHFGTGYKTDGRDQGRVEEGLWGNGSVKIELPELSDEVSSLDQSVLIITRDITGQTVTKELHFRVSRPVILTRSSGEATRNNCMQRYEPFESTAGLLSNGSNNVSTIDIRQGVQKIWTQSRTYNFGVYIAPFSLLGLGNLLALNANYFTTTSKSITETTEVASSYSLDPGDYLQVYTQATRRVTSYDAIIVGPCGETTPLEGVFLFQDWAFAYHVYPVNPYSRDLPPASVIGAPTLNTCDESLDPKAGRLSYYQTN